MDTAMEIVVCGAVRTPIGKFGGRLSRLSAAELGAVATAAAMERAGLKPGDVDEVIFGNARQAGGGPNVARQIAHRAGIPESVPAFTVNKACGSGLKCIVSAAQAIRCGDASVVVAGGTESMSGLPHLATGVRFGFHEGDIPLEDGMYRDGFSCPLCGQLMGETAETVAEKYGVSRKDQDAYAAMSQNRAEAARSRGIFSAEIAPVWIQSPDEKGPEEFTSDEHPRDGVTPDTLKKLPAVFKKGGTVHAGNSSGITDGAAAMVVTNLETARKLRMQPVFRLAGYTSAGLEAGIMGMGPVPALEKLQRKTGLDPATADLIELNEAFAAQVLACQREIGLDLDRLNVNGGAIALGHPIGATGARIVVSLLHEMHRRESNTGIATLCISGGMGMAAQFERVKN